jgi:hypothetical protein
MPTTLWLIEANFSDKINAQLFAVFPAVPVWEDEYNRPEVDISTVKPNSCLS